MVDITALQSAIDVEKENISNGLYKNLCDLTSLLYKTGSTNFMELSIVYPRKCVTHDLDDDLLLNLFSDLVTFTCKMKSKCEDCRICQISESQCDWKRHILNGSGKPIRISTELLILRIPEIGPLLHHMFKQETIEFETETVNVCTDSIVILSRPILERIEGIIQTNSQPEVQTTEQS